MKKLFISILGLCSLVLVANAQKGEKMQSYQPRHRNEMMMKELNLTQDQKTQLKAARENTRLQLAELNKNEDITVREFRERRSAIMKSQKEQCNNLLTPAQKEQIEKYKSEKKAKHEAMNTKRMERLKDKLELSDEQYTKIKNNSEANKAKVKAIHENSDLDQAQKKEQLMTLRKEQKEELKQILTPEQVEKLEQWKKDKADKHSSK